MADKNWKNDLNEIGKQLNEARWQKDTRKDFYWVWGFLILAVVMLLDVRSDFLSPIAAGVLTGIAVYKLKKIESRQLIRKVLIGMAAIVVIINTLYSGEIGYGIMEAVIWGISCIALYLKT